MKAFSLFLDFDDTIVETRSLIAQYFNKRYGVAITAEDIKNNNGFDLALKNKGVSIEDNNVYLDFGKNFFSSFSLENFNLYPGAKDAILNLSEIYNLYIVTSRQKSEETDIREILKHHGLHYCFKDIHCVWDFKENHFVSEPKKSFIQKKRETEIGISFIDDSIDEVLEVMKTRCITSPALFDPLKGYPKEGVGFEIFNNWKQIEKIFS